MNGPWLSEYKQWMGPEISEYKKWMGPGMC